MSWGPSGAVSLIIQAGAPRVSRVGCMCPPVVVEPQLLLACQWLEWLSGWLAVRVACDYRVRDVVWLPIPWSGSRFLRLLPDELKLWECHFWSWWVVVWSLPLGVMFLKPFRRGFCVGQYQPLFVLGLGLLGRCYKVTCSWLLFMLGLEVPGRGCDANLGLLSLVLGSGPFFWGAPWCERG